MAIYTLDRQSREGASLLPAEVERDVVEPLYKFIINAPEYTPSWIIELSGEVETTINSEYPSIEIKEFTGGPRAVIRGTRIPVSMVIGYLLMGEKPEMITEEILPEITPGQINDAVKYYLRYKPDVETEITANAEDLARGKGLVGR